MGRGKIILASVFLIVLVGSVVFFLNHNPVPGLHLAKTLPVQPLPSGIVYGADGKLDTSNWQEYRSEYGGFSVRAPRRVSAIGCFGHTCDPSVWGEQFYYLIIKGVDEDIGLSGLNIQIIRKLGGSTLDTWLDNSVVSGKNKLSNVQKISVGQYSALQFDRQKEMPEAPSAMVMVNTADYPLGNTYESGLIMSVNNSFRYLVVDLGDRYALIYYTLSIDQTTLPEYLATHGYSWTQALAIPDNKTLADIYATILDSFQAFIPTKP